MKHWTLRRSGHWASFDSDPHVSYYKFLRAVYGLLAWEALARVKSTEARARDNSWMSEAYGALPQH